ncbi:hypothetical protein GKQ77_16540 [Streptomyces sp. BG9H]|uniref:Uncharacterized protein n=1 Tax=Streptomyces anatolicus TaxID=2675858 RepID=A0ABS6YNZ6_9ACTN|nr:hypothetical protein [Streptomyces anatolicus]MBW5423155.1 hypothetical protein [Streptomyces anatolicus]
MNTARIAPVSPVSVTTGAVEHSVDFIRPRLLASGHDRVSLYAGVQINGAPHLGTSVMQTSAFLLARTARDKFGVDVTLRFGALDNAGCETRRCPRTGTRYERSFRHALGGERIQELIRTYYGGFFDALSAITGVPHEIETYTQQQSRPDFRQEFLESLTRMDALRWVLAPSHGKVPMSPPCPRCGWAQKQGEHTEVLAAGPGHAELAAVCLDHGGYVARVRADGTDGADEAYIGSGTLHRNLLKERVAAREDALAVVVKGADWAAGCRLLDEAFLCYPQAVLPARLFTPVVLSASGAKLSKSLIRAGRTEATAGSEPWMLDAGAWPGTVEEYARLLLGLVTLMLSEPRHFERGYTTLEVARLIDAAGLRIGAPA